MKGNVQVKAYLHNIDKQICYKINFQLLNQYVGKSRVPVPEPVREALLGGEDGSVIERKNFLNICLSACHPKQPAQLASFERLASLGGRCNIVLCFDFFVCVCFYETDKCF